MRIPKYLKILPLVLALSGAVAAQQSPAPTPTPPKVVGEVTVTTRLANSDPLYQKIRENLGSKTLGETATVNNFVWQKDRAAFTLRSGEIYFLAPVEGRVTGAVFIGDGELSLTPPVEAEKKHLALFTGGPEIKEQFTQLVMYFTDQSFEEVKNSPNVKMTPPGPRAAEAADALKNKRDLLKKRFRFNMSSRILADFLTPQRAGFFTAFVEGKKFGDLVYQIDPLGIPDVYPEQVALISYGQDDRGIWTAFHLADEYQKGTANSWQDRRFYDISHHEIETVLSGTKLVSQDTLTLRARSPGIRFIAFDLYRTLRVKNVRDENGTELPFIQEKKDEDADFGVILANAPEADKFFKITVEYEGGEALADAGGGNFFLIPRSTWYPNNPFTAFGDRATFDLTFRYPKKYMMVGVGTRAADDKEENGLKVSKWTTGEVEFEVAGFNYGDFKVDKVSDPLVGYDLEVYANNFLPAGMEQLSQANIGGVTLGALNTTSGMKIVLTDAQNALRIFSAFFGKLPYKRLAMTQQPAANFGQAWTTLVYMPYLSYFDRTQRVQLYQLFSGGGSGISAGTSSFWTVVGPHEVAHQWWGHIVGWTSYRDQWMSEGFSDFSASLFIEYVEKDFGKFNKFWDEQRDLITKATPATKGKKPYQIGALTQGGRLNSSKTGSIYRAIVYPKGSYVLHMLRRMMYDRKNGDGRFQAMMQDFIKTNFNKPVSTEDFKRAVEKYMTPQMDLLGNKKMDWFFDQWVYGTEMPSYKMTYQISSEGGKNALNATVTQSGVSDKFAMLVPIYVDYGEGWSYLGSAKIYGNSSFDLKDIALPRAPKKVTIGAYSDVLAENIEVEKK